MSKCILDLVVRGTKYRVTCLEANKEDLIRLANSFNQSVSEIALKNYQGSEASLFLIAALQLEDKIEDLKKQNAILEKQIENDAALIKEKERLEQFLEDSKVYIVSRLEKISKYVEDKLKAKESNN